MKKFAYRAYTTIITIALWIFIVILGFVVSQRNDAQAKARTAAQTAQDATQALQQYTKDVTHRGPVPSLPSLRTWTVTLTNGKTIRVRAHDVEYSRTSDGSVDPTGMVSFEAMYRYVWQPPMLSLCDRGYCDGDHLNVVSDGAWMPESHTVLQVNHVNIISIEETTK